MIVCVPNRFMIFLFQTVFNATEAAKLFISQSLSAPAIVRVRCDRIERDAAPVPQAGTQYY
jgi:hypothetical protein